MAAQRNGTTGRTIRTRRGDDGAAVYRRVERHCAAIVQLAALVKAIGAMRPGPDQRRAMDQAERMMVQLERTVL